MTQNEAIKLAIKANLIMFDYDHPSLEVFANLVAEHERARLQGQIETLHAMYELASKQRDYLMDQQKAQIEALRGKMQ